MKTAVIYSAGQRSAGSVAEWLQAHGWKVLTVGKENMTNGTASEVIDMLVVVIDPSWDQNDGPVGSGHDYDSMADRISESIYEAQNVVEKYLPALAAGNGRRIAFLTEKSGSIRRCSDRDQYVHHMILAGIHMQAKLLYNKLRPLGYTMRLFAAEPEDSANQKQVISAGEYFAMNLCYDEKEPYIHSEENRFVMRDGWFEEISW